jgi:solute carrier family 25 (mitochondrial carnitine/acylcarnitine transporter), member 20/29
MERKSFIKQNGVTIAATSSAVSSILLGYPFDSIKTRMQALNYSSTTACIRTTLRTEGFAGFYRGVLPLLVTSTGLRALSWNVYTRIRDEIKRFYTPGYTQTVSSSLLAGCSTGILATVISAPIEFVKVQRQLQKVEIKSFNRNLIQWLRFIVKEKGISGFYSGFRLQAPMDVIGTGLYFGIYESVKYYGPREADGSPKAWVSVLGGGISGCLSWIVVFPIDV